MVFVVAPYFQIRRNPADDRIGQVFCPAGLIGFRFGPKVGRR